MPLLHGPHVPGNGQSMAGADATDAGGGRSYGEVSTAMGVSIKGGFPKMMVFAMENPIYRNG